MAHISMDLETLGTSPGCAVLSIGATVFDPYGDTVDALNSRTTFYRNINLLDCLFNGLVIEQKSLDWWKGPSVTTEAQRALLKPAPVWLYEAVDDFANWFKDMDGVEIWFRGPHFDAVIWEAACKAIGREPPWKFWDVKDCRTMDFVSGFDPKQLPRVGTFHNGLGDAITQAIAIQHQLRLISTRKQQGGGVDVAGAGATEKDDSVPEGDRSVSPTNGGVPGGPLVGGSS